MIKELQWDSDFFGYKVGQSDEVPDFESVKNAGFRVIYIKSKSPLSIDLFCDQKITFSKNVQFSNLPSTHVKSIKGQPLTDKLLALSYLSGNHSRFKLDHKFSNGEFQKLYKAWIAKSLNGEIADEVFSYENMGFVTVKIKDSEAHIGLIAVSQESQGKGVGKLLLQAAENYAHSKGAKNLFVPTQLNNIAACKFYESYGFQKFSTELTYHYWVN